MLPWLALLRLGPVTVLRSFEGATLYRPFLDLHSLVLASYVGTRNTHSQNLSNARSLRVGLVAYVSLSPSLSRPLSHTLSPRSLLVGLVADNIVQPAYRHDPSVAECNHKQSKARNKTCTSEENHKQSLNIYHRITTISPNEHHGGCAQRERRGQRCLCRCEATFPATVHDRW